ncbi:hypothetical protein [Pseudomonas sp. CFBP 13727]|uniref:hypothetical protein n=1 Tax=Pseudomonas sp. CFBP 13727 TaxID=2775295 RepID=UPI000F0146EA|nr:hypothetical protein [Pseudomonas sp. CFBP 13727]MBD8624214.1 hypothetical protein [Pseudomonas sp. CFBP 13727]
MPTDQDTAAQALLTAQTSRQRKTSLRPTQALIDAIRSATRDGVLDTTDNPAHDAIAARPPRRAQPKSTDTVPDGHTEP